MKKYLFLMLAICLWPTIMAQTYKLNGTEAAITYSTAGNCEKTVPSGDLSIITKLTVSGVINASDIRFFRDNFTALTTLDLGGTTITSFTGTTGTDTGNNRTYNANVFPVYALKSNKTITSLILPNNITSIDISAFEVSYITSISGLSSVISIGVNAFSGSHITSLSGLSSLIVIGDNAFYGCSNLSSVDFPSCLQQIGYKSFHSDYKLNTITIPSGIKQIKDYAFNDCTSLISVYMESNDPSGITLGGEPFYSGTKTNGVLHIPVGSTSNYTSITYWQGFNHIQDDIQPSNTQTNYKLVGNDATVTNATAGFISGGGIPSSDWLNITALTIIGSIDATDIRLIRDNLTNLTTLNLDRAIITAYTGTEGTNYGSSTAYAANVIPIRSFKGCTGITNVIFPVSITGIDVSAFENSGLQSVSTLPSSLQYIKDAAFAYCSNLTELALPPHLKEIGNNAFYQANKLMWVTIPAEVKTIQSQAFSSCLGLKYIFMEASDPSSISLGSDPFDPGIKGGCYLFVPTGFINSYTGHSYWKSFSNIRDEYGTVLINGNTATIPNATPGILYNTNHIVDATRGQITQLIISGSIDARDFKKIRDGYTALTTLDLTNATIAYYSGTDGTNPFKSPYTYPANVFPAGALANRSSITTVYFPSSGLIGIDAYALYQSGIKSVTTLPPTLQVIEESAFSQCNDLTTVIFPANLVFIGLKAFENNAGISSIVIPASVTNIIDGAFYGCTSLFDVFLDSSNPAVSFDPNAAFDNASKNNGVLHVPNTTKSQYTPSHWSCFKTISEGVCRPVISGSGSVSATAPTALEVSNFDIAGLGDFTPVQFGVVWSTKGIPTTELSSSMEMGGTNAALTYQSTITGLAPATTYYIRPYATNFAGITYGDLITTATEAAVSGGTVTINGDVATVTNAMAGFLYNGGISSTDKNHIIELHISGSIDARDIRIIRNEFPKLSILDVANTSIAAYYGTEGTIQGSTIDYKDNIFPINALKGNSSINHIKLPASLTTIDDCAFCECDGLTSIIIPEGVTRIGKNAINGCNNLNVLTIPSSVTIIEGYAFMDCSNLATINAYPTTAVDLSGSDNVFGGVPTNTCVLRIPDGSLDDYVKAIQWGDFLGIVCGLIPPTVSTQAATNVSPFSALGNGTITGLGDAKPIDCGIVWSTTSKPTVNNSPQKACGAPTKTDPFSATISNLNPGTTYYVRAYVTNQATKTEVGTVYGNEVSFTTTTAQLTVSADPVVAKKIYDGTTTGTFSSLGTLSTITTTDAPNLTFSATATYESATVGTGKKVTVHYTLSGTAASRYIAPADYSVFTGEIDKGLDVRFFLEGLWNITKLNLNKCRDWNESQKAFIDKFPSDIADQVTVELHSSPYKTPVYTFSGLNLHKGGSVTSEGLSAIAIPPSVTGSYYITVKSRNHLPAVSASMISFTGNNISYYFTDKKEKSYASDINFPPTKNIGDKWLLYAGNVLDENSDYQEINIGDVYQVFNNRSGITKQYGYLLNDLDGNGDVDLNDVYMMFNNRDAILYIP